MLLTDVFTSGTMNRQSSR